MAWAIEPGAGILVVGALFKFLPIIAGAIGAIWYVLCIWESRPGQLWRSRWRGLFYILRGDTVDSTIADMKRKLEDMQRAREDRVLIGFSLGLAVVMAAAFLTILASVYFGG